MLEMTSSEKQKLGVIQIKKLIEEIIKKFYNERNS